MCAGDQRCCCVTILICTMMQGWMKSTATVSILHTLAQPFIFLYTLGCMVARTTNALAVANGPPTVWETLAN